MVFSVLRGGNKVTTVGMESEIERARHETAAAELRAAEIGEQLAEAKGLRDSLRLSRAAGAKVDADIQAQSEKIDRLADDLADARADMQSRREYEAKLARPLLEAQLAEIAPRLSPAVEAVAQAIRDALQAQRACIVANRAVHECDQAAREVISEHNRIARQLGVDEAARPDRLITRVSERPRGSVFNGSEPSMRIYHHDLELIDRAIERMRQ